MWRRPEMAWGLFAYRRSSSASWATFGVWTSWTSPAAPPTSRPGSHAQAPARSHWTFRRAARAPRGGSRPGSAPPSPWSRRMPSGPAGQRALRPRRQRARRGGLVRPGALAARGGAAAAARRSAGLPDEQPPVDAVCSGRRAALRGNGCCAGSARPTGCSGPAAESSSTPRTVSGSGSCAAPGSSSRRCTRSTRRQTARDHPFYEIVSREWASRWPAEELWVAVLDHPADETRAPSSARGDGLIERR